MTILRATSNWREVPLREVCSRTELINPESEPEKSFLYVDVSSVSNQTFLITEPKRIIGRNAPSRARKLIRYNDVIFATVRPGLKRIALVPAKLDGQVCSTGFCVLRAKPNLLAPCFLYLFLLTERIQRKVESLQDGAAYPAIRDRDLLEQYIPLPGISEQRAIAQVLAAVQKAKAARECELELEHERKGSLIEYLFTHGTRGAEPILTTVGPLPGNWKVINLGQIADITYGIQAAVAHLTNPESGIPIITNVNIKNEGRLDFSTLRYFPLPDRLRSRGLLRKGDVLFNWRSGSQDHVGKTALFEEGGEFTYSSFILRFRPSEKVKSVYLTHYLHAIKSRGYFAQNRQQSSVNSVFNASVAASIPVGLPRLEEQEEIGALLGCCDRKIATLEREQILADEFFRAMLEELMTGRLSALPLIEEHLQT